MSEPNNEGDAKSPRKERLYATEEAEIRGKELKEIEAARKQRVNPFFEQERQKALERQKKLEEYRASVASRAASTELSPRGSEDTPSPTSETLEQHKEKLAEYRRREKEQFEARRQAEERAEQLRREEMERARLEAIRAEDVGSVDEIKHRRKNELEAIKERSRQGRNMFQDKERNLREEQRRRFLKFLESHPPTSENENNESASNVLCARAPEIKDRRVSESPFKMKAKLERTRSRRRIQQSTDKQNPVEKQAGTVSTVQELKQAKKVTTNPFAEREKREKERLLAARRRYTSQTTPAPEDSGSATQPQPTSTTTESEPVAKPSVPTESAPVDTTVDDSSLVSPPPQKEVSSLPTTTDSTPTEALPPVNDDSSKDDLESSNDSLPTDSLGAISASVETKVELTTPHSDDSSAYSATPVESVPSEEKIKTSFLDDDSDDFSDLSSLDENFNYDDLSSLTESDENSEDDLVKNWPRPLSQVSAESLKTAQQGQRWDSQVLHCSIVRMAEDVSNVKRVKIYSPSDSRTITGFGRVDQPSFDTKKIFFPIQHDDGHWCLVEIHPTTKDKESVAVSVYDSVPLANEREFFQKRWAYVNFLLQGIATSRMFSIVGWKTMNMDIERCDSVRSSAEDAGPFIVEIMKARCEDRPFSDVTPELITKRREVTQEWISSQFGN